MVSANSQLVLLWCCYSDVASSSFREYNPIEQKIQRVIFLTVTL